MLADARNVERQIAKELDVAEPTGAHVTRIRSELIERVRAYAHETDAVSVARMADGQPLPSWSVKLVLLSLADLLERETAEAAYPLRGLPHEVSR